MPGNYLQCHPGRAARTPARHRFDQVYLTNAVSSAKPRSPKAPQRAQQRIPGAVTDAGFLLDAAYFHLYGLERDEVEHVMESFDALRRREEKQLGEFRTKRLILERYDAMAEAAQDGTAYQTILDPSPGHGARHPARPA